MSNPAAVYLLGVVVLAVTACAPATAPAARGEQRGPEAAALAPQRTLAIAVRREPLSLARKPLLGFSGALNDPLDLFNATLEQKDDRGTLSPYLAEALPQVDTDTWRRFPDGRTETTHRLKPNLNITVHVAALTGQALTPSQNPDGSGELMRIHEWEWRS